MKEILILGGTRFIGRVLVEQLLDDQSISITLFNRGKSNTHLFPEAKRIVGDRNTTDFLAIAQQDWDVVIDFSGFEPASLESILPKLKGKVGRYIYISSLSSYRVQEYRDQLMTEDFKTNSCSDDERKDGFGSYGPKKAECERILMKADWLDKIILRPAIVYGKYDYTDRFLFWFHRIRTHKKLILPNGGREMSNFTYVGDLAKIILKAIDIEEHSTFYNVTTHDVCTRRVLFDVMSEELGTQPEYINVDGDELLNAGYTPGSYSKIPLWFNCNEKMADNRKVQKEFGIEFYSLQESIRKTIEHYDEVGWHPSRTSISRNEELAILGKVERIGMAV